MPARNELLPGTTLGRNQVDWWFNTWLTISRRRDLPTLWESDRMALFPLRMRNKNDPAGLAAKKS